MPLIVCKRLCTLSPRVRSSTLFAGTETLPAPGPPTLDASQNARDSMLSLQAPFTYLPTKKRKLLGFKYILVRYSFQMYTGFYCFNGNQSGFTF